MSVALREVPLAGPNWLCGSHDPAGLGTVPGADPRSCLVRGRGHGLRVSTAPCVTARVDGHIVRLGGGGLAV